MNWLKNLFGGGGGKPADEAPAKVASPTPTASNKSSKRKEGKRQKVHTVRPSQLLRSFASFAETVGATNVLVDDFCQGAPRDDGLLGRVTFALDSVTLRLRLQSYDGDAVAWIETRTVGVHGDFNLEHVTPGSEPAQTPDEPRFHLTRECYVSGPRVRNEVARILSLPSQDQERLFALALGVDLVKLDEQVLGVVLGDLFALSDALESAKRGNRGDGHLLATMKNLLLLSTRFPPLAKDVAELAEARSCHFCGASFVFSPQNPTCTACGAPATKASLLPPPPEGVIPDDPIEAVDENDADEVEDREERRRERLALARKLAALVERPRIVEEPERARTFVEYELEGRAFRAKLMDEYVGIRTEAKGVKGNFFLGYSEEDIGGEKVAEHFWRESEKCYFFSKHCRVRSGHGTKEALRLGSLPVAERTRLVDLCERLESNAQLEEERLAIGLGENVHREGEGVALVVSVSRDLGRIADAFPRQWDEREPVHFQLKACSHCGWSSFAEAGQSGCMHCGGPLPS